MNPDGRSRETGAVAAAAIAKETFAEFQRHRAQWLAAAIAYFTVFAAAPLIIIAVEIAGTILGRHQDVLNELYGYLSRTTGASAAEAIRAIVASTLAPRRGGVAAQIIGWGIFLFAAMGLFTALQEALNTAWGVEAKKRGILGAIRSRALAFGAVLAVALLLLAALGANAMLTAASTALAQVSPFFPTMLKLVDFAASFAVITTLFAMLFKYLPECPIEWRDVWTGAAATSLLFVAGQFLLGWYLGRAGIASAYGAFGSLVAFLVWVNYSAQIVLLGAEFTHVFARRFGSRSSGAS